MEAQNVIRDRLGRVVRASGASPKALSRWCKLSPAHIGMILRGDVAEPDTKTLRAIATKVGVSLTWLAFGEGAEPDDAAIADACSPLRALQGHVAEAHDESAEPTPDGPTVDRSAEYAQPAPGTP